MLAAAYAPLLVLLAVLDSFRISWLRWVFLAMALIGVISTLLFFLVAIKRRNPAPEKIYSAKPREGEALKFFASYVVPFIITTTAVPAARWGLLVYLLFVAVLYVQGDMYFSNPLLALLGFRVFELTRADRGHLIVISREWHLSPSQVVRLVPLGGYVYVHVRDRSTSAVGIQP